MKVQSLELDHCHKHQSSLMESEILGLLAKLFCDIFAGITVEFTGNKLLRLFS